MQALLEHQPLLTHLNQSQTIVTLQTKIPRYVSLYEFIYSFIFLKRTQGKVCEVILVIELLCHRFLYRSMDQ